MKRIHFIGIGGIGVSALARYYLSKGLEVSGSDLVSSEITKSLEKEGVRIYIGHDAKNIEEGTEKVVYSAAVGKDAPGFVERQRAKELKIPTGTYSEALGELTKKYTTIAVAGSHGKGTTTAMLSLMIIEAGLDPTVIVGTRLKEFDGKNFRAGGGDYLVMEADEYDRSFLNYKPNIAVVTNVDNDHLDIFGDINGVIEVFNQYLKNLPDSSLAIVNAQDKYTEKIIEGVRSEIVYFDMPAEFNSWNLQVPGKFNQLNAEAAWQAAKAIGVKREVAENAVSRYMGAWRRMEPLEPIKGFENAVVYADYGHHPTEILLTTKAFKEKYPERSIFLIFQPHQVKRLDMLFDEFKICFRNVDELVLLPVYQVAGREEDIGKTSEDLTKEIEKYNKDNGINQSVSYLQSLDEALRLIDEQVVIFMGAGDIDNEVRKHFRSKLLPG